MLNGYEKENIVDRIRIHRIYCVK